MPENRPKTRSRTTWKPGQSGNPGGRPKVDAEVRAACQLKGTAAIAKLVELLTCGKPEVELRAAEAILDRAVGRPRQAVDVEPGGELADLMREIGARTGLLPSQDRPL